MGVESTFVEVRLNGREWNDQDWSYDRIPYFYYAPSRITNIEPNEGPTAGNTRVVISGNDFKLDKKIICYWGNIKNRGIAISMNEIAC